MSLFWNQPSFSSDFSPLFKLLDDYAEHRDVSTRDGRSSSQRLSSFTPRFDIAETETAYELHGDLPGVKQQDIDVTFNDAQTLTISGKTERHTEHGVKPNHSHDKKATVEDVDDQAKDNTQVAKKGDSSVDKHDGKNKYKYWSTERVFGSFSRTFTFPSPVDTDAVKASLKEGVLSLTVPKKSESGAKKIQISA